MRLKHRLYLGLKTAKSNIPLLRRVRLLKMAPPVVHYGRHKILEATAGNQLLLDRVGSDRPIAAGKIGDCELETLVKYEAAAGDLEAFFHSISKAGHELDLLYVNTGVFPKSADAIASWAEAYLQSLRYLDLIGVWYNAGEEEILEKYAPQAILSRVRALEPYYHDHPWSKALKGTRTLVVTSFPDTVRRQRRLYRGADLFANNPDVFPDFELETVRSPFSPALVPPLHTTWHEALSSMEDQIRRTVFDVCLVGAGAYSLPLCAFVRSELGQTAIHLGGAVQVLFGMKGKRWDGNAAISGFYNDAWTRPLPTERPKGTWRVEGSAYW